MSNFEKFITRLKLEALALALLMVVLVYINDIPLWSLPASFLLFDIGMIGYLKSAKIGALTYNATHDLTVPTLCIAVGLFADIAWVAGLGYLWTFHIAVDRSLGYGLNHTHSFTDTHMGKIGHQKRG